MFLLRIPQKKAAAPTIVCTKTTPLYKLSILTIPLAYLFTPSLFTSLQSPAMASATVVTPSEYLPSRLALLEKEKEHTRANDAIAALRRSLPLVEIKKPYTFTGLDANGHETKLTLTDLFSNRRQLIIKHVMFSPDWDAACTSCSMSADYLVALEHLHSRDTSLV
jgi:predicted dithiol-disulfide oxidoreductase (DUF899 family)